MVTNNMLAKVLAGVVLVVLPMDSSVVHGQAPGGISLDLSSRNPPVTTALLNFYIPCNTVPQFPCSTWQLCVELCCVFVV